MADDGDHNADLDTFRANVVRFMLNQSVSKAPIKKADIVQHCMRGKTRLFAMVYELAAKTLKKSYGMCIYKVDGAKSGVQFLCVSKSANLCLAGAPPSGEHETNLPVLFLVLAYVYMKGGRVTDHAVFAFLDKCGIISAEATAEHPHFGDVRKLVLDTYAKQLYVKKTKETQEGSADTRLMLEWGQRAELEFPRHSVLAAVAQLMDRPAASFVRQHEELQAANNAEDDEEAAE